MKVAVRIIGTLFCILIVASFLAQPGSPKAVASAPVVEAGEGNISSIEAPSSVWATRDWTDAEMAAAQPYPLPELAGEPQVVSGMAPEALAALSPSLQLAGMPEGMANQTSSSGLEMLSFNAPTGYTYPGPYTRYMEAPKYDKKWPAMTVGKVFFSQNGGNYVCSAASIGGYAVWTAGHCVHDGRGSGSGWSYNFVFVPGYFNGSKKLGQWKADHLWVRTAWYAGQDFGQDMGGAILDKLKRKRISQKVGWLGFAYNFSPQQHWFAQGYPQASPFDGGQQWTCAASYAYGDASFSPSPMAIGCDQTGGTSGGPWIWQYGTGYYLNGNMSYRYTNHPHELFSPWFNQNAADLWNILVNTAPLN